MCVGVVGGVGRDRVPGCVAVKRLVVSMLNRHIAAIVGFHVARMCVVSLLMETLMLMNLPPMLYEIAPLGPALRYQQVQALFQAKRLIYG